jgi:cysteine desulfurase / selenocysteine lyase
MKASTAPADPAARLEALRSEAIGLDTRYTIATGERTRRIYLDSTATTLRLKVVQHVLERYQPHYANTHSKLHFGARLSTQEYQWAHRMVLEFVGADPATCMSFFTGSGATAGMNRVARALRAARPERDVVLTSIMEHHSNDLPHRKHFREVVHVPAEVSGGSLGRVDLALLERALEERPGKVNYIAITGMSNVTGIINPVHDAAALAHRHGACIVVDAAQMAAHLPIRMSGHEDPARDLDALVFSGHKVYAPGSPGVVVARSDLFAGVEPQEVGGGMVDAVWVDRYTVSEHFPEREEAGTPNIPGAIGLAAALYALQKVGMHAIAEDEERLIVYALERLAGVPGIIIYGDPDPSRCRRAGAISINLERCDHAFTAAVLNDYYNIAVRNECFCAHPYVREMVMLSFADIADTLTNAELELLADMHRGMVRASFGLYTTQADIDALVAALKEIGARRDELMPLYERQPDGDYVHRHFRPELAHEFSVRAAVDRMLEG